MTLIEKVYAGTRKTLRTADKTVMVLVMLIIMSVVLIVPAYASGSGSRSEVTGHSPGSRINIAQFSGLITDSFSDMMTNVMEEPAKRLELLRKIDQSVPTNYTIQNVTLSNVGNVLGLQSDVTQNKQSSDVFTPGNDVSSKRLDLKTIEGWYQGKIKEKGKNTTCVSKSVMTQYIVFGSALNYIGIDEFRDARENSDGIRMIVGYAMYICFILAYSAAGVMSALIDFLNKTNVFGFVHNAIMGAASGNKVLPPGNGTSLELQQNHGIFQTLANVYARMQDMRWVVFGLLVVLFVGSITVFKSKQMGAAATNQTRLRNLLLRVVVMCIGIPLVGMVYSTLLGVVSDSIKKTEYRTTDFIFSQFLDYEAWTLTDPGKAFNGIDGMTVVYSTNKQSMDVTFDSKDDKGNTVSTPVNVSKLVYDINKGMYSFITKDYEQAGHTVELYLPGETKLVNYEDMLEGAKIKNESELSEDAYNKARDLILGYARSNTLNADVLNEKFIAAYDDLTAAVVNETKPLSDEDKTSMSVLLSRIFDNTASSYRLWSYTDNTEYTSDAYGNYKIEVRGIPIFPGSSPSTNYMQILGQGTGNTRTHNDDSLMKSILTSKADGSYGMGLRTTKQSVEPDEDATTYTYTYAYKGMSALALYNYMHSKFSLGAVDIYTPDLTTNSGVSTMHYSVTTPYSGIPEMIQLAYTICILFSIGIIGWVFGMSLMLNTIVQMFKAVPLIFKMAIGSIQGFVEALLTVMSVVAELFVTILLYTYSIQIIGAMIALADGIMQLILKAFVTVDGETMSIVNNLMSMLIILWTTFELIKWRQAITISIKSLLTHVLNQIFGTSAAMPTGASSGMLKAAALGGAAAMTAGALADQGTLDDVINDMTQSDLGSSLSDKLKEGDYDGAWNDVKDYANGNYAGDVRGGSAMDREANDRGLRAAFDEDGNRLRDENTGELMYEDGAGNKYTASEMQDMPNAWQDFTENQAASLQGLDDQIGDLRAAAAEARKNGDTASADKYEAQAEELAQKRAGLAAGYRSENYAKAKEAGVADYAAYEKSLSDSENEKGSTYMPEAVAGAENLPGDPGKALDADGRKAYKAARRGDARALQSLGDTYNEHGLTGEQIEQVDEMIANGASETDVAAAIDGFAQSNFGDNYKDVVAKLNEANGRSGSATYGSNDNAEGKARTVHVSARRGENGGLAYGITDNNSQAGTQTISVVEDGQGGVGYTNLTAGGGERNTIETVDMGNGRFSGAASYAGTYNAMAAMVRAGGGAVSNANIGAGTEQQVTVTELAAMSSRLQMAENDVKVNVQSYGNTGAQDIGTAMAMAQVQADFKNAITGNTPAHTAITTLGASSKAGEAAGVPVYQGVVADNGTPAVTIERVGGPEGAAQTIKVDYNNVPGNSPGGANYVSAPSAQGGEAQPAVNVGANGDGGLKLLDRDTLIKLGGYKLLSDFLKDGGDK